MSSLWIEPTSTYQAEYLAVVETNRTQRPDLKVVSLNWGIGGMIKHLLQHGLSNIALKLNVLRSIGN